jgi:hypothetical protein
MTNLFISNTLNSCVTIDSVVRLNDIRKGMVWVGSESSGGIFQRNDILLEFQSKPWHHEDPQGVSCDTYQTVWAKFCRERRCMFEGVVDEGGELQSILISIVQPRSTGESHDCRRAVNSCSQKFCWLGSKEPRFVM